MKLLKAGIATLTITATVIGCNPDIHKLVERFPVPSGELEVRTVTGGANIDPDGYELLLSFDLGPTGMVPIVLLPDNRIGANDVRVESVTTDRHTVTLADISANCSVDANPQVLTVPENGTRTVTFNVTCS